jgi:hypothetical protein
MPMGGPTAQQAVTPIGNMTPADIAALVDQLVPAVQKFRASSTIEPATLNQSTWANQGDQVVTQIASVGLGIRVQSRHHFAITLKNAGTAAETVTLSSYFPYNLINNTSVSINGGATVYSASGPGGLVVAGRRKRGFFRLTGDSGVGPAMNPGQCLVNVGANGTITNSAAGDMPSQLSGIRSISIAGSSSCVITADFNTTEWFVLDEESFLGALPLQNNSTYAILTRTLAPTFVSTSADDMTFPFYIAGADVTVNDGTAGHFTGNTAMQYHFASVPTDASLYTAIVSNSYQVVEQPGILGTAAVGGLTYNIPQNMYLVALHRFLKDGENSYVMFGNGQAGSQTARDPDSVYLTAVNQSNKRVIQYNGGSVIPVVQFPYRTRGRQHQQYDADLMALAGYLLWDGEDTSNDLQAATDNMGWIDCYNVASPQSVEDLGASINGTPSATFVREVVVAGSVSVVGG